MDRLSLKSCVAMLGLNTCGAVANDVDAAIAVAVVEMELELELKLVATATAAAAEAVKAEALIVFDMVGWRSGFG